VFGGIKKKKRFILGFHGGTQCVCIVLVTIPAQKNKCVTFATLELKAVAEEVIQGLQTDPATSKIASEVVHTDEDTSTSLFNRRLTQITLIKNRQLHDYLKVCLVRLQTNEYKQDTSVSQTHATDHLCILKALIAL
jgi:hypothetical protein